MRKTKTGGSKKLAEKVILKHDEEHPSHAADPALLSEDALKLVSGGYYGGEYKFSSDQLVIVHSMSNRIGKIVSSANADSAAYYVWIKDNYGFGNYFCYESELEAYLG